MKVRRDISSIPLRTAEETWKVIEDLVTGDDSVEPEQFNAAATVMASLIADEAFNDNPLTMTGVSHRLVMYLFHASDALEAGADVDALAWNPTAGDWRLFVPCPEEEFNWARKTLSSRAPRFVVIKPGDSVDAGEETKDATKRERLAVNWGVFGE